MLAHYEKANYDRLLLLGDLLNYGPRNQTFDSLDPQAVAQRLNQFKPHIVCVRGNCDSEVDQMLLDFPIMADYAWLMDEGRRIFLTHGHLYNESQPPASQSFDVLFCGHSHLPHITPQLDGSVLVNTGSPTFPKGGNPPTFASYEKGCIRLHLLDGSTWISHQLP